MTLEQEIWFMYRQCRDKEIGGQPTTEGMWQWVSDPEKEVWAYIINKIWDKCLEDNY